MIKVGETIAIPFVHENALTAFAHVRIESIDPIRVKYINANYTVVNSTDNIEAIEAYPPKSIICFAEYSAVVEVAASKAAQRLADHIDAELVKDLTSIECGIIDGSVAVIAGVRQLKNGKFTKKCKKGTETKFLLKKCL